MKVEPDEEMKNLALQRLTESNQERDGIHVTDLVYCLREAYWRKKEPVPPTTRTLSFFLDGARRHVVLQELLGEASEVEVEKYGVTGRIDVVHNGIPVELKTTRSNKHVPEHYLKQLGYYAVMLGTQSGYLIIQRLFGEEPFEFYRVEWSEDEIKGVGLELLWRSSLLREALKREDPSILPEVEEDVKWKCSTCQYREKCEGMK